MSANKPQNRAQAIATEDDSGHGGRFFACLLAIVALLALFAYRAATSDPLWEDECSPAAKISN